MEKNQIRKHNLIDFIEISVIALLIPLFLFPDINFVWVFFIIPLIWIIKWRYKGKFLDRTILDLGIAVLIIQILISCFIVPDIWWSLPKISGTLLGIFLFYALVSLFKEKKHIKIGINLIIFGGVIFTFVSIFGMARRHLSYVGELYKLSTFIPKVSFNLPGAERGFHHNAVGGTLALIFPLFFVFTFWLRKSQKSNYVFSNSSKLNKAYFIFITVFCFVMGVAILLTTSRGTWIATIISILFILFLPKTKQQPGKAKKEIKIGLILVGLFFIGYMILIGFNKIPIAVEEMEGKITSRMELWKLGMEKIDENFFGLGMNYFRQIPEVGYETAHAHNHLIHTASELGIPGLVAYLAILVGTGYMCYVVLLKNNIRWMRMAVLGLGAGQLAHFLFGMADSIPLGAKTGVLFWVSLALITGIYNYTFFAGKETFPD